MHMSQEVKENWLPKVRARYEKRGRELTRIELSWSDAGNQPTTKERIHRFTRPERTMAFGVSRRPLIFFTEEIKTNRGENKSADYINKMMLVGQQR